MAKVRDPDQQAAYDRMMHLYSIPEDVKAEMKKDPEWAAMLGMAEVFRPLYEPPMSSASATPDVPPSSVPAPKPNP